MRNFVRPLTPSLLPKPRPVLMPSLDPANYLKNALPRMSASHLQRGLPGAGTYSKVLRANPLGRPPQL